MHIILLTGAALIGVPVLLHLIMRQEPKRLPFPAFRFLKMKRRINQRRMRLRHLLLLAMRMALIALTALALYQPKLLSERFNIKGEKPIACVVVLDTSPSLGYILSLDRGGLSGARKRGPGLLEEENTDDRKRPWTELDEARFRAMELLDELPPGSKVAVIDTADRDCFWSLSLPDARKKIREIKKTRASSRSVTDTLPLAYQLLARVDQDAAPGEENIPKLLAVFSDRTVPSWSMSQIPYLKEMKERVPKPDVIATYIDVGVDKPVDLAITAIDMKPQVVPANRPFQFAVALQATGARQENILEVRFTDNQKPLTQAVRVDAGAAKDVPFQHAGLPPGLYQAEITLATPDALPANDTRYLTFRVPEPRRVLLVVDAAPAGMLAASGCGATLAKLYETTHLWQISLSKATGFCTCDIAPTAWLTEASLAQVASYEVIVFAGLVNPSNAVWDRAAAYVENGGKLIVAPGANEMLTAGPDNPPPGYDNKLLPGAFQKWLVLDRLKTGATWTWDALKSHELLTHFREYQTHPDYDFVAHRPQAWGYWEVQPRDKTSVIVSYADDPDADKRRPALLERQVGKSGKVILFTTPMDGSYDEVSGRLKTRPDLCNDYASTSFYLVLTNLTVSYLIGATEDATFNFTSGQSVIVKWPLDAAERSKFYYLSGPDLSGKESELIRGDGETFLRLGPERLKSAGNYLIVSDPSDKKPNLKPWRDGFSLNPAVDEYNLERVPAEQIESLFGPESLVTADKERKIEEILGGKFSAPIELFPFLMILLLLFLAFENLLSNKFYRQAPPKNDQ